MADNSPIVQRIATKALIVNSKGQLLILREASTYKDGTNVGRYHLPGGRLEPGEAYLDGLRREVDEETGLTVTIGKPVYVGEWRPVIRGVPNQIIAIFFLCKPQDEAASVRLSDEHDDFQWVMPADIHQFDLMSPEDKVIAAYVESLGQ